EDPVAVTVLRARPGDREAGTGGRDRRRLLAVRGVRIDLELGALMRAVRGEALAEHARAVAVLVVVALPDDHEVAVRLRRDRGQELIVIRVGIDLKLRSGRRSIRAEALA